MTELHRQTEQMREVVNRTIQHVGAADVRSWLTDRLNNCYRHAATKTGDDRNGWLEDAAFFAAAIGMIDWTELEREAPERNALIEECAKAAEAQDRAGYEWVRDSLWANILRRAGANVRKLKNAQSGSPTPPSERGAHD